MLQPVIITKLSGGRRMTSVLRREDEVRDGAALARAHPGAWRRDVPSCSRRRLAGPAAPRPAARLPGAAVGTAQCRHRSAPTPLAELPSASSTPASRRGCSAGPAAAQGKPSHRRNPSVSRGFGNRTCGVTAGGPGEVPCAGHGPLAGPGLSA